ncbi:MAG: sulfurtransferase complex subunit TusB [Gammaproteobacteria bacterium]|nr:sulfurtransferase complex subunit TusB [Gammaproteobacteria bacterium]MDH3537739.1 sulfurtransferase complex subunit TusB [Gammaproteobacteria bacterium]
MPVLHIVNKSPYDRNSLDTCLRLARADAAILLIEDGIYAAQKNAAASDKVQHALGKHPIYALQPDLQARGINPDNMIEGISLVDYDGFVKLTTEYDKLQSWL